MRSAALVPARGGGAGTREPGGGGDGDGLRAPAERCGLAPRRRREEGPPRADGTERNAARPSSRPAPARAGPAPRPRPEWNGPPTPRQRLWYGPAEKTRGKRTPGRGRPAHPPPPAALVPVPAGPGAAISRGGPRPPRRPALPSRRAPPLTSPRPRPARSRGLNLRRCGGPARGWGARGAPRGAGRRAELGGGGGRGDGTAGRGDCISFLNFRLNRPSPSRIKRNCP